MRDLLLSTIKIIKKIYQKNVALFLIFLRIRLVIETFLEIFLELHPNAYYEN